jgi:hypothetical protein
VEGNLTGIKSDVLALGKAMKLPNTGLATLNDNRRCLLREIFFDNKDHPLALNIGEYVAVQFYNKRIGEWDVWVYEASKYYRDSKDALKKIQKLHEPIVKDYLGNKET